MSATETVKPSIRPREPRFFGYLAEYDDAAAKFCMRRKKSAMRDTPNGIA